MNQREIALEIIYKSISDNSYTNLLMRKKLEALKPIQRPFVTNLVSGVLKNYDYLIYQVSNEIKSNTSLKNKIIIAMALYEKFYLNKESYILNEYVSLGKNEYDRAFINAILRKDIKLVNSEDDYINNSLPKWIYNLLKSQYSKDDFDKILENYKRVPTVYYRINHKKAKFEDFKVINILNDDIFTSNNNLIGNDDFNNGLFYMQDINSASLYKHLDLKKDDVLLDVCSAPGSKLFNCLDIIKEENAFANELHTHRLDLIINKAKILGFNNINYLNYDGRVLKDNLNIKFDKIMLDVPCSGLGTIGRKPDLKYHIKPESLDELELIQYELLESNKELLKDNGVILYSTCTLNKKENSKQVLKFIKNNPEFKVIEEETIINDLGDCFYYAVLKR